MKYQNFPEVFDFSVPMRKVSDVTKSLNLFVLIDVEFSRPDSLIIAAGRVQRNDFKFNRFHQINDRTDELQIQSGGWWVLVFSSARGRYVKGREVLNLPPGGCWATALLVVFLTIVSQQEKYLEGKSLGAAWMQGTLPGQSSFSNSYPNSSPKHARNTSVTCTAGIFFFPLSIRGQIQFLLFCLM